MANIFQRLFGRKPKNIIQKQDANPTNPPQTEDQESYYSDFGVYDNVEGLDKSVTERSDERRDSVKGDAAQKREVYATIGRARKLSTSSVDSKDDVYNVLDRSRKNVAVDGGGKQNLYSTIDTARKLSTSSVDSKDDVYNVLDRSRKNVAGGRKQNFYSTITPNRESYSTLNMQDNAENYSRIELRNSPNKIQKTSSKRTARFYTEDDLPKQDMPPSERTSGIYDEVDEREEMLRSPQYVVHIPQQSPPKPNRIVAFMRSVLGRFANFFKSNMPNPIPKDLDFNYLDEEKKNAQEMDLQNSKSRDVTENKTAQPTEMVRDNKGDITTKYFVEGEKGSGLSREGSEKKEFRKMNQKHKDFSGYGFGLPESEDSDLNVFKPTSGPSNSDNSKKSYNSFLKYERFRSSDSGYGTDSSDDSGYSSGAESVGSFDSRMSLDDDYDLSSDNSQSVENSSYSAVEPIQISPKEAKVPPKTLPKPVRPPQKPPRGIMALKKTENISSKEEDKGIDMKDNKKIVAGIGILGFHTKNLKHVDKPAERFRQDMGDNNNQRSR